MFWYEITEVHNQTSCVIMTVITDYDYIYNVINYKYTASGNYCYLRSCNRLQSITDYDYPMPGFSFNLQLILCHENFVKPYLDHSSYVHPGGGVCMCVCFQWFLLCCYFSRQSDHLCAWRSQSQKYVEIFFLVSAKSWMILNQII